MGGPFTHIACCVDDSPAGMAALAEAARLAAFGPARLTVVHVVEPPSFAGAVMSGVAAAFGGGGMVDEAEGHRQAAEAFLAAAVDGIEGAQTVLLDPARHDSVPDAVCDWAREEGPDLLVAATHRGTLERARRLVGSFSGHLARHAPCPVLLVPPGEPG
ncbi:MAG: universal stress protein [Thermoleophilia bacterium]|jgi:nucleotide-binding universal stress UspA family protein|nr:universal stress protein [Thermoleophilia bacterium]